MNLGAIDPKTMSERVNVNTQQTIKQNSPIQTSVDPMDLLKKYAPYILGAIVLYYIISKK